MKRKKGPSKKGPPFERDTCRELSRWWLDNEREDIFWRTSGSGARATTRRKQGKKTRYEYGDISFRDPVGKLFIDYFLIELKRGYTKDISVLDMVDKASGKDTVLLQWWKKAEDEKKFAERKYSIIIFRRNSRVSCIMMEGKLFNIFQNECGEFYSDEIIIYRTKKRLTIITLRDFFDWVSPATIMELARESNLINENRK